MPELAVALVGRAKREALIPDSNTTRMADAWCIDVLNDGLTEIGSAGDLEVTETQLVLVAGQRIYELEADIPGVRCIKWACIEGESVALARFDPREAMESGLATLTGKPMAFGEWNSKLILQEIPDSAYRLNIVTVGDPSPITSLEDTLDLQRGYRVALFNFLVGRYWLREKEADQAKIYLDFWGQFLESMRSTERRRKAEPFGGSIRSRLGAGAVPAGQFRVGGR